MTPEMKAACDLLATYHRDSGDAITRLCGRTTDIEILIVTKVKASVLIETDETTDPLNFDDAPTLGGDNFWDRCWGPCAYGVLNSIEEAQDWIETRLLYDGILKGLADPELSRLSPPASGARR
jgi:hypothetical protein